MSGKIMTNDLETKNINIQLSTNCNLFGKKITIPKIEVMDLIPAKEKLILGLDFCLAENRSVIITKDYLLFSNNTQMSPIFNKPISELTTERGETSSCDGFCKKENGDCECRSHKNILEKESNQEQEIEHEIEYELSLQNIEEDFKICRINKVVTFDNIQQIIDRLNKISIIGEDPTQYWEKDPVICKLDIINPDLIIKTKDIQYGNLEQEECQLHVKTLLGLKVIRPSTSPHRSPAFIVNKQSEQKRGKTRMVYNYKRLNDNTNTDGYTIPSKDVLINRIQKAKWFSKFDLKSGFHQVRMDPDSIKWTAFSCSEGLFEWKVMPFGLKNAPQIFQRKMDNIFGKYKDFTCTYIDDILIFSKTKDEHYLHLKQILYDFEKYGLIISKSKMEICKNHISFLGTEIGNGKIKLQPHISQKIIDFPDRMEDIKTLRAFLGLLNYTRNFIKNLGKYTAPLYNKTSLTGERKFNTEDIKLVREIKEMVKTLPELNLPLDSDYLIIECDGCEQGWGAILKRKKNKYNSSSDEEICRYASGKYHIKPQVYSTSTDYEVNAVINSIKSFKLFLINKKEIGIKTDCEAIVAYANSQLYKDKKPPKRWILFQEMVYHDGLKINFEHIKGKSNVAADILSRFTGNNETFKVSLPKCKGENEVW